MGAVRSTRSHRIAGWYDRTNGHEPLILGADDQVAVARARRARMDVVIVGSGAEAVAFGRARAPDPSLDRRFVFLTGGMNEEEEGGSPQRARAD